MEMIVVETVADTMIAITTIAAALPRKAATR
jgi:hypothetical protein